MSEQETVLEASFSPQVFSELKWPVEPVESLDTLNDSCLTLIPVHLLLEPLISKFTSMGGIRSILWVALASKREQATHRMLKNPLMEFPNLHLTRLKHWGLVEAVV